jgi:excinuclease ABC subunit A
VKVLDVVADRFRLHGTDKTRAMEAIEVALKRGHGRLTVYVIADAQGAAPSEVHAGAPAADTVSDSVPDEPVLWRYSTGLHCPDSDLRYAEPQPAMFSFNSAMGACPTCRGFGRVIGVDYDLVIPDHRKTLRSGAIKADLAERVTSVEWSADGSTLFYSH